MILKLLKNTGNVKKNIRSLIAFRLGNSVVCSGGFNKHQQPVKSIGYLYIAQRSWLLLPPEEEATSSK